LSEHSIFPPGIKHSLLVLGIISCLFAVTAIGLESYLNWINALDGYSRTLAIIVGACPAAMLAIAMHLPFTSWRAICYSAALVAFCMTVWSGLDVSLTTYNKHMAQVEATLDARGSSKTDEAAARAELADARKEAASARAEAAKIGDADLPRLQAGLAAAQAALTGPKTKLDNELALAVVNERPCSSFSRCRKAQTEMNKLQTAAAILQGKVDAAKSNMAMKTEALTRARAADIRAEHANAKLEKAEVRIDSKQPMAVSGGATFIADMIAWRYGEKSRPELASVIQYKGISETGARLILMELVSLLMAPGIWLLKEALPKAPSAPVEVPAEENQTLPVASPVRMGPITAEEIARAVVAVLRQPDFQGRIVGQNRLADLAGIPRATLSDKMPILIEAGHVTRKGAMDGKSKIIELASRRRV
jgi:hypothetical protein